MAKVAQKIQKYLFFDKVNVFYPLTFLWIFPSKPPPSFIKLWKRINPFSKNFELNIYLLVISVLKFESTNGPI